MLNSFILTRHDLSQQHDQEQRQRIRINFVVFVLWKAVAEVLHHRFKNCMQCAERRKTLQFTRIKMSSLRLSLLDWSKANIGLLLPLRNSFPAQLLRSRSYDRSGFATVIINSTEGEEFTNSEEI